MTQEFIINHCQQTNSTNYTSMFFITLEVISGVQYRCFTVMLINELHCCHMTTVTLYSNFGSYIDFASYTDFFSSCFACVREAW